MRRILVAIVGAAAGLALASPALAHNNTIVGEADCRTNGTYLVTWTVTNSQAFNETITASSRPNAVPVGATFAGQYVGSEVVPGSTSALELTLTARWANGVTRTNTGHASGFGEGCANTTPPPATVRPRAHFWGPCGDPYYRAVFDNRRSGKGVTFRVSYRPYGEPRRTFSRWVPAHKQTMSGLFDVAGSTRMTIRVSGRTLASKLSASNRVYGACPAGVPVVG